MKFEKYRDKFNKEEILKLNKEGNNIKQIAEIIGIPNRRLGEMCKYFNVNIISNFTIPINHDYFDIIDTEAKAYILGYTIADGCVTIRKRKNKNSYRLNYLVSVDDREAMELIHSEISPKSKLGGEYNTQGAINRKPQLRLRFTSKKIVTDLIDKYDIIPNKTINGYNFKLPDIDDDLKVHLIRGIFDGDGHIGKNQLGFSLNSKYLCEDIYNEMKKYIPKLTHRIYEIQGKTCKYYSLYLNLGHGVRKEIEDYFYDNANNYLTRKKNKF